MLLYIVIVLLHVFWYPLSLCLLLLTHVTHLIFSCFIILTPSVLMTWWLHLKPLTQLCTCTRKAISYSSCLSSVPWILTMRLHVHVSGQWCSSYVHLYMYMDCALLCSRSTCTLLYLCVCLVLGIVCHWLNSYDCEWCTWIDSVFAYVGVIDLLNSHLYPSLPYSPPLIVSLLPRAWLHPLLMYMYVVTFLPLSLPLSPSFSLSHRSLRITVRIKCEMPIKSCGTNIIVRIPVPKTTIR